MAARLHQHLVFGVKTRPNNHNPTLRVLEIASLIPGPYCGKLLASLRAEVIKAEPPGVGGPSCRRSPPVHGIGYSTEWAIKQ